jgi:small subunit ribosomal protein S27Ae
VYTKPKKAHHVHKKVKLSVLKYYKVDNGKVTMLKKECPTEVCGAGTMMAAHADRFYCGKCGLTYMMNQEGSAATAEDDE